MKEIPVYRYPWSYAAEHGEKDQYRESLKANIYCKEAIEAYYRANTEASGYGTRLVGGSKTAVKELASKWGLERISYVIANTLQHKDHDGRFSPRNKEWAKTIPIFREEDKLNDATFHFIVDKVHPCMLDDFVTDLRNELLLEDNPK